MKGKKNTKKAGAPAKSKRTAVPKEDVQNTAEIPAEILEETTTVDAVTPPSPQKRGGRKAMTENEKEVAAKKRAEEQEKAKNMTPALFLQYQGDEIDIAALTESAKADFKAGHKRTLITDLKLYIKPEERTVYYVVNGEINGKVTF